MKKSSILLLSLLIPVLIVSFMSVKPARSQSTTLFLDPAEIVDDTKQSGSTFTVYVNISDVTDLYGYQVTIMWEPAMLNATSGSIGGFHPGIPFQLINNSAGYIVFGQTLWGPGAGISGSGRLWAINFLVEDYGATDLAFDFGIFWDTFLIDSSDDPIPFVAVDGYFRNTGQGDANGDGTVDIFDIGAVSAHWYPGPPVGPLGYDKDADNNMDGNIDIFDIGITSANWGNTYP